MIVPLPTEVLLGEVGSFDNELSAYLWFDYLRSRPGVDPFQVLLMVREEADKIPLYRIQVVLPNDALTAVPFLADLEAKGFIQHFDLAFSSSGPVEYSRKQTEVFVAAYKRPLAGTQEQDLRETIIVSHGPISCVQVEDRSSCPGWSWLGHCRS